MIPEIIFTSGTLQNMTVEEVSLTDILSKCPTLRDEKIFSATFAWTKMLGSYFPILWGYHSQHNPMNGLLIVCHPRNTFLNAFRDVFKHETALIMDETSLQYHMTSFLESGGFMFCIEN